MIAVLFLAVISLHSASANTTVYLLGLFPEQIQYNFSSQELQTRGTMTSSWSLHSLAMFRAAIKLAEQYGLGKTTDGSVILGTHLYTSSAANGLSVLNQVCKFISNQSKQIVGIVGPPTSNAVRFLGPFAAEANLPIVSYAATNPDLSDTQLYNTFYRTIPSDRVLALAIIDLFTRFDWHTCILIIQKDDYGYGGMRLLSENYYDQLEIVSTLIFDMSTATFHLDLYKTLTTSRSKIVLVWSDSASATVIIKKALENDLIGTLFVWLTTNEVELDVFKDPADIPKLIGLLSVIPIESDRNSPSINHSLFQAAIKVWKESSNDVDGINYTEDDEISPEALFAFDATWTLLLALAYATPMPDAQMTPYCFDAKLNNSENYHQLLDETNFIGVTGPVSFSDDLSNDRVGGAFYALRNVQWQSDKTKEMNKLGYFQVMHWSEVMKNISWINLEKSPIVWPNNATIIPADRPLIKGRKLRIRVIESAPFVMLWNRSSHTSPLPISDIVNTTNSEIAIYGFIADLILLVQSRMGFYPLIDIAPSDISYNELVDSVYSNDSTKQPRWHVVIADATVTSTRVLHADFSQAIHENSLRVIVRDPKSISVDLFSFVKPFSWQVWLVSGGLVIYSGLLVYFFERHNLAEKERRHMWWPKSIGIGLCRSLGSIMGVGNDTDRSTVSSRILTIALWILCAILTAIYTANLSSFLTLQRTQPLVSGIDDIKNGRVPFNRIGIVTGGSIFDYYHNNVSTSYFPLNSPNLIFPYLLEGKIDAALWDSKYLEYEIDRAYCDRLTLVGVGFAKSSFAIAMIKDWRYKADLDFNILLLREGGYLEQLEKKWSGREQCSSNIQKPTNPSMPLLALTGLFQTFIFSTLVAFLLHLWGFRAVIGNKTRIIWTTFVTRVKSIRH